MARSKRHQQAKAKKRKSTKPKLSKLDKKLKHEVVKEIVKAKMKAEKNNGDKVVYGWMRDYLAKDHDGLYTKYHITVNDINNEVKRLRRKSKEESEDEESEDEESESEEEVSVATTTITLVARGGHPKGTTNDAKRKKELNYKSAVTECTKRFKREQDTARENGFSKLAPGTLDNIITSVKSQFEIDANIDIKPSTIISRVQRAEKLNNPLSLEGANNQSPVPTKKHVSSVIFFRSRC